MGSSRLYLKVCVTSTKWEMRLHFNVRVSPIKKIRISTSNEVYVFKATWLLHLQDLRSVFTSAISSTIHWHKQMTISPWFNSTPTTSSEHQGDPDCVFRHLQQSFLVALKSLTVHSRRPKSRQDQDQGTSNDYQSNHEKYEFNQSSKYFKIGLSQLWNIENFGGGSVGCLKITKRQAIKKQSFKF